MSFPTATQSHCALLLAGLLSATLSPLTAEILNGGFETYVEVRLDTGGISTEWPTTDTWCRSSGGLTPYMVSGADAHEGNAFVILLQWSSDPAPFFGLAHETDTKEINSTGVNLFPVEAGKTYTISFSARRWFDEARPLDVANMWFLPPSDDAPDATLRAYAFFSATKKVGADAKFLGDVIAPTPPEKDGDISITGKWTLCKMTVSAPANGFLWLGFKIKPPAASAGLLGYGEPAQAGVKYALDDVKIVERNDVP